jgi:pyruvate formate-lyase activating enzyme-like uncharacterized protein
LIAKEELRDLININMLENSQKNEEKLLKNSVEINFNPKSSRNGDHSEWNRK